MTFDMNKCATMVVKPLAFNPAPNLVDPIFCLSFHPLPQNKSIHLS